MTRNPLHLFAMGLVLSACPDSTPAPKTLVANTAQQARSASPAPAVEAAPIDEDGDGFAGSRDRCPGLGETWNNLDDQDGCPEDSPSLVSLEDGRLQWKAPLAFQIGKPRLKNETLPSIRAAAALIGARRSLRVVVVYRYRTPEECRDDQHRSAPIGRGRIRSAIEALVDAGVEREQVRAEGPGDYGPRSRTLGPGISIVIDDADLAGPMSSHCQMTIGTSP